MIEQQGIVVDTNRGYVWVETQRESSCGGCSAKPGCGTALLNRSLGQRFSRIRVSNDVGARTGDCVVLGIPEQALLKGSFAVYLVPLLGLLGGAVIAHFVGANVSVSGWHDLITFAGGATGFVVGLQWVRRFGERVDKGAGFQPVLLRRVPERRQNLVTSNHCSD